MLCDAARWRWNRIRQEYRDRPDVTRRRRLLTFAIPTLLAALELVHPTWSQGSVSQAVQASGPWWVPLHVLLTAGYGVVVYLLWVPAVFAHVLLGVFLVCNTAFLGVDGLAVGLLAAQN